MRKLLLVVALGAGAALGQARTISTNSAELELRAVVVTFRPDGGCLARPVYSVTNPEVRERPTDRAFNGARCIALRAAAQTMAELDQDVGDGGAP